MKYLRKFATEADVMMFVSPNVVLIESTGSVLYNVAPPKGVMVQHIDGKLYTVNEWTGGGFSNDLANGIAVITDATRFVIAKNDLSAQKQWSSNTSNVIIGIMSTSNKDEAKTDFSGYANTELMLVTDTKGAGYSCANFIFPNGSKGYLPAAGEWNQAYAYKSEIDAALLLIGGTAIRSSYYWSSTQTSGGSYAWRVGWNNGTPNNDSSRSDTNYVRAFTVLSL